MIKDLMKKKMERIRGVRSGQQNGNTHPRMCVYEFRGKGACRRQEQCKFEHSITEQQRSDPALT